ncbi:hypothetical protein D3C87_1381070 [compost metagenome]
MSPLAASDRMRTTMARLDDASTASTAEKINATGQALPSMEMKRLSAGDCRIGSVAAERRCRESSIRPTPARAAPAPCRCTDFPRNRMTPARISIGDSQPRPSATIHAVVAVPTFAPSSTICAIAGAIKSFSTKEATISAVAVELCRAIVATRPAMKERNPPRVPAASPMRSLAPKARDIPSLICPRPKSSSATAPNRLMLTTTDSTRSPRLSCLPPLFPEGTLNCPVDIADCVEKPTDHTATDWSCGVRRSSRCRKPPSARSRNSPRAPKKISIKLLTEPSW